MVEHPIAGTIPLPAPPPGTAGRIDGRVGSDPRFMTLLLITLAGLFAAACWHSGDALLADGHLVTTHNPLTLLAVGVLYPLGYVASAATYYVLDPDPKWPATVAFMIRRGVPAKVALGWSMMTFLLMFRALGQASPAANALASLFSLTGVSQVLTPLGQCVQTDDTHIVFVLLHLLSFPPLIWLFQAPFICLVLWGIGIGVGIVAQNVLRPMQLRYCVSPAIVIDEDGYRVVDGKTRRAQRARLTSAQRLHILLGELGIMVAHVLMVVSVSAALCIAALNEAQLGNEVRQAGVVIAVGIVWPAVAWLGWTCIRDAA